MNLSHLSEDKSFATYDNFSIVVLGEVWRLDNCFLSAGNASKR